MSKIVNKLICFLGFLCLVACSAAKVNSQVATESAMTEKTQKICRDDPYSDGLLKKKVCFTQEEWKKIVEQKQREMNYPKKSVLQGSVNN